MNLQEPVNTRGSIGDILVSRGLLQPADIPRVIERQQARGEPFGAAAVALKLVSQAQLDAALATQFGYDYLQPGDASVSPEVVTAFKPFSNAAEELRALRSQLLLRGVGTAEGRKLLAIVSPQAKDGRSFIAANLAVAFAQQGQRTLLVDADLRQPRQGQLFKTPNTAGLAGILAGRVGTEVVSPVAALPGLSVLAAGGLAPNPQELLSKPAFAQLLANAAKKFDVVLVDTPAASTASDAEIIAARTGAALVVARQHKSLLRGTTGLAQQLQQGGVVLVGSVLNQY